MKKSMINRVRCKKCGSIIEYVHPNEYSNPAHLFWCDCHSVGLDPSVYLFRILGNPENYEDLSDYEDV